LALEPEAPQQINCENKGGNVRRSRRIPDASIQRQLLGTDSGFHRCQHLGRNFLYAVGISGMLACQQDGFFFRLSADDTFTIEAHVTAMNYCCHTISSFF
jgi:hypothetical protein